MSKYMRKLILYIVLDTMFNVGNTTVNMFDDNKQYKI